MSLLTFFNGTADETPAEPNTIVLSVRSEAVASKINFTASNFYSLSSSLASKLVTTVTSKVTSISNNALRQAKVSKAVVSNSINFASKHFSLDVLRSALGSTLVTSNKGTSRVLMATGQSTAINKKLVASSKFIENLSVSSLSSLFLPKVVEGTIAMSSGTTCAYKTSDGSWSTKTMPAAYITRRFNGSYWIGLMNGGSSVGRSADGYTWVTQSGTNLPSAAWWSLAWSPELSLWCAGAGNGTVATSPDGITWTTRTPSIASQNWNGCAWGNGLFVMTGRTSANFMTSPNGINWTTRSSANGVITGVWNDVIYDGTTFVACDQNSTTRVLVSTDGITWSQKTFTTAKSLWWLATDGNGTIVCAPDNSNMAVVSTDHGVTWQNRTLPSSQRWGVTGVAWTGTKFVMCCYNNTAVAESIDGLTWTSSTGLSGTYTGPLRSSFIASSVFYQVSSAISNSMGFLQQVVQKNITTVSNGIVNLVKQLFTDLGKSSSFTTPALFKGIELTKNTMSYSSSDVLYSKVKLLVASALSSISATAEKVVKTIVNTHADSYSNTSKAALLNRNVLVNSSIINQTLIQKVVTAINNSVSEVSKDIASLFSSSVLSVSTFISSGFAKMFYVTGNAISTSSLAITKLIETGLSAISINTAVGLTKLIELVNTLISFFVTINNDEVINKEVRVTESVTEITSEITEEVSLELPGQPIITINIE